jgi:hypothetical protein
MWRNNNLRIFPAWMMTKHASRIPSSCLARFPSLSIPSRSLVFMCFTRIRASPYATYVASIRCVVIRAPRSSRSLPPSFFFPAAPCPCQSVSVTQSFQCGAFGTQTVFGIWTTTTEVFFPLPSLPFLPLSYLIINHCSEAKLLYHHIASFRSVGRKQEGAGVAQPSGDDRGCVSWAPMGGSTVP